MAFDVFENHFSFFGNFNITSESAVNVLTKIYEDCDISIIPENKAQNMPKRIIIKDKKKHLTLDLSQNRLEFVTPALMKYEDLPQVINSVKDDFNSIALVLDGACASRIALVSHFFYADESKVIDNNFIFNMPIGKNNEVKNFSIVLNEEADINNEKYNLVVNVNHGQKNLNTGVSIPGLVVVYDCFSLAQNKEERFELNNCVDLFVNMYKAVALEAEAFGKN